jgi:hypothetical protein
MEPRNFTQNSSIPAGIRRKSSDSEVNTNRECLTLNNQIVSLFLSGNMRHRAIISQWNIFTVFFPYTRGCKISYMLLKYLRMWKGHKNSRLVPRRHINPHYFREKVSCFRLVVTPQDTLVLFPKGSPCNVRKSYLLGLKRNNCRALLTMYSLTANWCKEGRNVCW